VFKVVGAAVALYVLYALSSGEIFAKRGAWGVTARRDEQPFQYWSTVVVYAVLSVMLFFFF
jgi:hypothetical protein